MSLNDDINKNNDSNKLFAIVKSQKNGFYVFFTPLHLFLKFLYNIR